MTEERGPVLIVTKPGEAKTYHIDCVIFYHAWDKATFKIEARTPEEALRLFKNHEGDAELVDSDTEHWEHIEDLRDEVTLDDVEEK
jgi:hypothetical protein